MTIRQVLFTIISPLLAVVLFLGLLLIWVTGGWMLGWQPIQTGPNKTCKWWKERAT
jgi:hypothetical protein